MNRILTFALLLLLVAAARHRVTAVSSHEDASGSAISSRDVSEAELEAFIAALQKAVAADDRQKVASMILYPIVIVVGRRSVLFKTPASLASYYNQVFTPLVKKLIRDAKPKEMFRNWQGAMLGSGEIWINEISPGGLKIVTIQDQTDEQEEAVKPLAPAFKVHPSVFTMIGCWVSDSEYPVVTEINLDAVAKDDNEFDPDQVKQDGEWIRYSKGKGQGYTAYRVVKVVGNRYTVQVQDNGGGTLTTSAIIEFVVEERPVRVDGKVKLIRVLRVLSYTSR